MSDINQDDIDKLLRDALSGDDGEEAQESAAETPPEEDRGPASQDDIDALFAAVGEEAAASSPEPAEPAAKDVEPPAAPEASQDAAADLEGVANQDDIDALFAAVDDSSHAEPAAAIEETVPLEQEEPVAGGNEEDLSGIADQADIDALFGAIGPEEEESPPPAPEDEPGESDSLSTTTDSDEATDSEGETRTEPLEDADSLDLESQLAEAEAAVDAENALGDDSELDALLSSIADETAALEESEPAAAAPRNDETVRVDTVDMDELLKQVTAAAPPPPPVPLPSVRSDAANADTTIIDMDASGMAETLADMERVAPPSPPPAAPAAVALPPPPPPAAPAQAGGQRREFSVLYGAGEVESISSQISMLISSMSEKAHGYMQAWIAADSEAKELRTRALAEERRRSSLEGEKAVLAKELDELRSRLGELEGGKVAIEEAKRTLETSFQAKVRELESRISLLSAETETLKDELTRARNQATGVDIESRRARFEADRLKNEVESERMERLRIQRALENREKELQAVQAQSSGQASSLFLDELHRLVRRLETELESRGAGAHEALKQLDRLETGDDMVPVVANLRAALMRATGIEDDGDDALKSLGREAAGVKGTAALAPGKAELASFETAIATYNLSAAIDIAGALLRDAKATPGVLMRKIYQCPALRRPEVADHLTELSRLLEGLRTVQESSDRSRGMESGESEVFYVQMFDFLHNLVRLKLITRLTGEIWRVFLDLRGRFSFVTSDKQWAEYRDQTLGDRSQKA